MQQSHQSKIGLRACNTLPRAACSPATPLSCSAAVHTVYFLSSILNLARATAVYIYIILKLPQLSWHFPLPGHRNSVLVHHSVHIYIIFKLPQQLSWHHSLPRRGSELKKLPQLSCTTPYSCTSRAPLCTRAPLVHDSILVHLSCTTRTRASLHTRAPLVNHFVLVHLSCTTPYWCTTLDHRRGRPTIFR